MGELKLLDNYYHEKSRGGENQLLSVVRESHVDNEESLANLDFRSTSSDSSSTASDEVEGFLQEGAAVGNRTLTKEELEELDQVKSKHLRDTCHVRAGRSGAVLALLATGMFVTILTFRILRREQQETFEQAFEQFAGAIAASGKEQQQDIRSIYESFAATLTASAKMQNATWPFFTLPLFETYARRVREQTRTEMFHVLPIVLNNQTAEYVEYANGQYQEWVQEGHDFYNTSVDPVDYHPFITQESNSALSEGEVYVEDVPDRDFYVCSWQFSPPPQSYDVINWNKYSKPGEIAIIDALLKIRSETLISEVRPYNRIQRVAFTDTQHEALHEATVSKSATVDEYPHSFFYVPVYEDSEELESRIVAIIVGALAWDISMTNLLPQDIDGIQVEIRQICEDVESHVWQVNGPEAVYLGKFGDAIDFNTERYADMDIVVNLTPHTNPEFLTTPGHCQYEMHIYPTELFENQYDAQVPELFALIIGATFFFVTMMFCIYDLTVQRRNEKLLLSAAKSNTVLSSFFPTMDLRDRILEGETRAQDSHEDEHGDALDSSKAAPLADLFLETTIMFADLQGFTAWSSTRSPTHVFSLLECLYSNFDKIAKKRRIFKVETVGDCYVAASGLPEPREDHAVAMALFARDIVRKMRELVKDLEIKLGPDTGDLALRVGLNSGPVTAGVLKGDRARFQLFGDTVNTCARIEAAGYGGRIHLSQSTADALRIRGKGHWLEKRKDAVEAKGKGRLQTWFLVDPQKSSSSNEASTSEEDHVDAKTPVEQAPHKKTSIEEHGGLVDSKIERLIRWNVEILSTQLKKIVARRLARKASFGSEGNEAHPEVQAQPRFLPDENPRKNHVIDEVADEIVRVPSSQDVETDQLAHQTTGHEQNLLSTKVMEELHNYISAISSLYNPRNAFHNFEHASHVTMSVLKLLSRMESDFVSDPIESTPGTARLISRDPLVPFACAWAALVHDVDHEGVPNSQMVKEKHPLTEIYGDRSVAEQNSFDVAWNLLVGNGEECRFKALRDTIFVTNEEMQTFRQVAINAVMATDIVDVGLKDQRNQRWSAVFAQNEEEERNDREASLESRRATIVIEHLMQASDVSHTMQHWHVYIKWNERFFQECYKAWMDGRAAKDPSTFWYEGEIGFFDHYIIPLTKKLHECAVFGKSSHEYLDYALKNRQEWTQNGKAVVAEMLEKCRKRFHRDETAQLAMDF